MREPCRVLPDLPPSACLRHTARSAWQAGVPEEHLAFCVDNGNYFTLSKVGRLGYFDHIDGCHTETEAGFADWVREEWLEL